MRRVMKDEKALAFALKKSLNAFKLAAFIFSYQGTGKMPIIAIHHSMNNLNTYKKLSVKFVINI